MNRVQEVIEELKRSNLQVQQTHNAVRARLELIKKNADEKQDIFSHWAYGRRGKHDGNWLVDEST